MDYNLNKVSLALVVKLAALSNLVFLLVEHFILSQVESAAFKRTFFMYKDKIIFKRKINITS